MAWIKAIRDNRRRVNPEYWRLRMARGNMIALYRPKYCKPILSL
jgi:hypothetical protein